jgi:hypothetical protein
MEVRKTNNGVPEKTEQEEELRKLQSEVTIKEERIQQQQKTIEEKEATIKDNENTIESLQNEAVINQAAARANTEDGQYKSQANKDQRLFFAVEKFQQTKLKTRIC